MSYFVLPRPEGTMAYKPSYLDMLMPAAKKFADNVAQESIDSTYRKAAQKEGLEPSYSKDAEGNWTIGYKKPDSSFKNILFALAGLTPMESAFSPNEIKERAPLTFGPMVEGGEVGLPDGSKLDNGVIRNAAGQMIGEYDEKNPPAPSAEAMRSKMVSALSGTESELGRKALGLSTPKEKTANQLKNEDYEADLQAAIETIKAGGNKKEIRKRLMEAYPHKAANILSAIDYY